MSESETRDMFAQMRTLLAAERTFSAWIRTGLAGVGGGLVIVKLIPFPNVVHQQAAHIAGQLLVIWGATVFVFATWAYWRTHRELRLEGTTSTLPWAMVTITAILLIVALLVLWILFEAAP